MYLRRYEKLGWCKSLANLLSFEEGDIDDGTVVIDKLEPIHFKRERVLPLTLKLPRLCNHIYILMQLV